LPDDKPPDEKKEAKEEKAQPTPAKKS
jgi:hypothetical protein